MSFGGKRVQKAFNEAIYLGKVLAGAVNCEGTDEFSPSDETKGTASRAECQPPFLNIRELS